jgi:HEAT repeat protein
MSNDPKDPGKSKDVKEPAKRDDAAAGKAKAADKPGAKPQLDERPLRFSELASSRDQLQFPELVEMLRDGRAVVRANAALGLAAVGAAPLELVTLLRDSETRVAAAAAEAIAQLGIKVRPVIPQIAQALDGAKPEVAEVVVAALAELTGAADDELVEALDVPLELAMKGVIEACGKLGGKGIAFLVKATANERSRIRINAIAGLGRLGKADPDPALACLSAIETSDPVPDIRTAAKKAMLAIVAREKVQAVDSLPKNIPDFEARKLSASELSEYADKIDIDQMIYALTDGRDHVRINAARALGAKGDAAARAAPQMGLLLRDSVASVRRDVARALGKLGQGALGAAGDLVGALGDKEEDVAEAAAETLEPLGVAAQDALVKGLETGSEPHGLRVGALIGKLPRAAEILGEAFKSPAVNVQVNAALGLGMLGKARVGVGLEPLLGARTGGDARTREAVRRALDMIQGPRDAGPRSIAIDGFEERFLAANEVDKHKAELERAIGDLAAYLQDGRDVVRANAATALGAVGAAAAGTARALGVLLRDDSARVRLSAATAIDRIGDAAVLETADDLVGALRDADDKNAATCANVLRARKARMIGALVKGLETDDATHGRRINEVIGALPDATDILCDAFDSPAVNVQVNAAMGLGMLGPERVGKGRKRLEGARTGGWERTRDAVRKALEVLDGPRSSGPGTITVDGFETRILEPAAFDASKLRIDDLVAHLQDGRAIVRANAATAIGAFGAPAAGVAGSLGVLMRDDDMAVRIRAAQAIDKLGDDAVKEVAAFLVGALRGDAEVAKAAAAVLATRKARVQVALVKGLETDDETHGKRIVELIAALPDACEILCDAFESPAENTQVNAALGIGMLGSKRAGTQGKKLLEGNRTKGFARTREAVFRALAMLKDS